MSGGNLLGDDAVRQIARLIADDRARYSNSEGHRGRWQNTGRPQPCPNSMIGGINGNATGGTWECRLYEDGDFISGTDFDIDWDVTADELATLIETANGYDPEADPVVGFPAYVTGGPSPFTGFIIKLKKGWHLSVHGNSLTGTGNPIPFVTPCCGST